MPAAEYDLRDNPRSPRSGAYFAFSVHGGPQPISAWSFLRWHADARGYIPLGDLFTISEEPKQALEDRAAERFRREVGLVPFLTALYQWRGATRSLWFESTEKLVEQLGTTGLEMITPLVMQWMEKKKD